MENPNKKRWTVRGSLVFIVLCVLLCASLLWSLKVGAVSVTWKEVYDALILRDMSGISEIIRDIRLPRVLVGALTGMNLALAGAILQGILRNPLADPGILGITSGAALVAMVIMILLPAYIAFVPIGAFIGAMGATFLVYGLSWQGGLNPLRLVLAGVAVAAFLGGFNTVLSVFYPDRVQGTVSWMAGGFVGRSWQEVWMILPYTGVGVVLGFLSLHVLTLLSLGDDMAKVLGLSVEKARILLLTLAALLAASAVSVAGMLGFVGLIVPHLTRLLVGNDYWELVPNAIVMGAFLLVGADTLARVVLMPLEIPVGVFMSFLGAPFFLYLLKEVGKA